MTDGDKPDVRPQDVDTSLDGRQTENNSDRINKGGRPLGSHDKKRRKVLAKDTRKRQRSREVRRIANILGVDFFPGSALTLLQMVYKDQSQPGDKRIMAANMALPYESPRLSAVEHSGAIGTTSHEEALDQLRKGRETANNIPVTKH